MPRISLGREYHRLWGAAAISNLGDGVFLAALPLLAASLSDDPLTVSSVTAALALPWLILALVSGALVDRWNRLVVMARVDLVRGVLMVVLAGLVLEGLASIPLLVLFAFLLGAAETLFDTAALAAMPSLVAPTDEQLHRANARLEGVRTVATEFLGPPLGGALFAASSAVPVLADAASFLASTALLRTIRRSHAPAHDREPSALLTEIREGVRWLLAHPVIRLLAGIVAILNFGLAGGVAILVLFLRDDYGVGPLGYGIVLSLGAIGAVAGNIFAERYGLRLAFRSTLTLAVVANGVALSAMGLVPWPPAVAVGFALAGFGGAVWNVITVSYRQRIIPPALLGRVNSVYRFIAFGAMPLGAAAGGLIASHAGLRAPYLVSGSLILGAAILISTSKDVRSVERTR
jgi:MFS family permease